MKYLKQVNIGEKKGVSDHVFLIDTPVLKIRECFSTYMQVIKRDVHFTCIRSLCNLLSE